MDILPLSGKAHYVSSSALLAEVDGALIRYPVTTVPLGVFPDGMPFGLSFLGRKWSEPTLLALM